MLKVCKYFPLGVYLVKTSRHMVMQNRAIHIHQCMQILSFPSIDHIAPIEKKNKSGNRFTPIICPPNYGQNAQYCHIDVFDFSNKVVYYW